jgi:putative aminopeptidase FrvX
MIILKLVTLFKLFYFLMYNIRTLKISKMKLNKKFLKEYLNSTSPTGFEYELGGQKVWMDNIAKYVDSVEIDNYGTAYGVTGNLDSDFKVVIEAHSDEISWFVNYIDSKGYIRVIRNGGSDVQIAPSMRVNLWGDKGPVSGVFGHPAIHITDRKKEVDLNSIFIDIGASSKEDVAKMGIKVGTVVTFKDELMELGKNYYSGRALDNRIGGFMIAEVARKLKEKGKKLPFKLYIVNSVQEEIGLRGAEMIAHTIKPNVAIVTDVCHETSSPCYTASKQGDHIAGDGGVITRGPAVHNKLRKLILDTAEAKKIPHQLAASSRSTGTDTDAFAYANGGTPSALISLPLKYMHTTCETVHKNDIKNVIELIYETLLNIEENHNFKYNS